MLPCEGNRPKRRYLKDVNFATMRDTPKVVLVARVLVVIECVIRRGTGGLPPGQLTPSPLRHVTERI